MTTATRLKWTAIALAVVLVGAGQAPRAQEGGADPHHPAPTVPDSGPPAAGSEAVPPPVPRQMPMQQGMPMMENMPMMQGMMGMHGRMQGMPGMMDMQGMAGGTDDPVAAAFEAINRRMHREMAVTPSGSADADFVRGMIAHHRGAIDMAKVVLGFGSDPEIRKLAEGIIAAQAAEIAQMEAWLAKQPK